MTCYKKSLSGFSLLRYACVAVLALGMIQSSSGQEGQVTMKFDNLYEIRFTAIQWFLQCLCKESSRRCLVEYRLQPTSNIYIVDGLPLSDSLGGDEDSSNTFLCHPGRFTPTSSALTCIRLPDSSDWCDRVPFCQSFHVRLSDDGCDSKCINVKWISASFEASNFGNGRNSGRGSCETDNHPRQESSLNQSCDTTSLKVAAAFGWILFGLLAGLVIAWVVYQRKPIKQLFRREKKPSIYRFPSIPTTPNAYGEQQTRSQRVQNDPSKLAQTATVTENGGYSKSDDGYTDCDNAYEDYVVLKDKEMPSVGKKEEQNGAKKGEQAPDSQSPSETSEPVEITIRDRKATLRRENKADCADNSDPDNGYSLQKADDHRSSYVTMSWPSSGKHNASLKEDPRPTTDGSGYNKLSGGRDGPADRDPEKGVPPMYNVPATLFEDENKDGVQDSEASQNKDGVQDSEASIDIENTVDDSEDSLRHA